jgi:Family of unknown function (DUF6455)
MTHINAASGRCASLLVEDRTMNARRAEQARFPTLDRILGAIARLLIRNRQKLEARTELAQREPGEVERMAHDLKLTPRELVALAGHRLDSAAYLDGLLAAIGVDRTKRPFNEPALIRDMQRLCVMCDQQRRCGQELDAGTAAARYPSYCPNAYTLDYVIGRSR